MESTSVTNPAAASALQETHPALALAEEIQALKAQMAAQAAEIAALRTSAGTSVSTSSAVLPLPDQRTGGALDPGGLAQGENSSNDVDSKHSGIAMVIRSVVADMNNAPTSLHQTTVAVCLDAATATDYPQRPLRYLGASFLIVALQLTTLITVNNGTEAPSCLASSDCPLGDFCSPAGTKGGYLGNARHADGDQGQCQQCLDEPIFWWPHLAWGTQASTVHEYDSQLWLRNETGYKWWTDALACGGGDPTTLGWLEGCLHNLLKDTGGINSREPFDTLKGKHGMVAALKARYICREHTTRNLTAWEQFYCAGCFNPDLPTDGFNVAREEEAAVQRTISLMRAGDWVTLILVAVISGMHIAGEIRDIKLAQFLVQEREDESTPKWISAAVALLATLRQFVFLPVMAGTIPKLVFWNGSTAVDICFNAVAILFLLDFDNAMYAFCLPEATRSEIELSGYVAVDEKQTRLLTFTKLSHTIAVAVTVPISVFIALLKVNADQAAVFPSFFAFFVCGALEIRVSDEGRWRRFALSCFIGLSFYSFVS